MEHSSVHHATIRFAGDSGDGIQLTGERFTVTAAMMGDEVATMSDFPAEIRAPAGTVGGVSGFQLSFGSDHIFTAGEKVDTLVVMNPAALKINIDHLKDKGILIINQDTFTDRNLEKAGYETNPLETDELSSFQVFPVNITTMTKAALAETSLKGKDIERCKNFFALGITLWLYQKDLGPTKDWLNTKFAKRPELAEANKLALEGGWTYCDNTEQFAVNYEIVKAEDHKIPGTYRHITGNKAAAFGLVAAAKKAGLPLYLGSYPITPATEILQELSALKNYDVVTLQAEDEIAAIGSAIGAAFGGALAVTSTSGPGMALKSEFLNLAVITELPLVVIDVQRAGPSTGMPTKPEQSDLLQALWGRNGDSPMVVIAANSPDDCFNASFEAAKIAIKYMTPVVVLSDSSLANGAAVWRVPQLSELPEIEVKQRSGDLNNFQPYARDAETLARSWVIPGVVGGEHRLGGLEKQDLTGNISYVPSNHQKMTELRAAKVAKVAEELPPLVVYGAKDAKLLLVGWGSTYGVIRKTVERMAEEGYSVACTNLRYINPLPKDLKALIERHEKVLVPETNLGQLFIRLRMEYTKEMQALSCVEGQAMREQLIEDKIKEILGSQK